MADDHRLTTLGFCSKLPRTTLMELLDQGVQLLRIEEANWSSDAGRLAEIAEHLNQLLEGISPERLAFVVPCPATPELVAFLCAVPVGTVIVPTRITDRAALAALQQLPVEKRIVLQVMPSVNLVEEISAILELFGIERLMLHPESETEESIAAIAEAIVQLRVFFGISGLPTESVY